MKIWHIVILVWQACADKLTREMAEFGTPPVFPQLDAADTGQGQKVSCFVTQVLYLQQ